MFAACSCVTIISPTAALSRSGRSSSGSSQKLGSNRSLYHVFCAVDQWSIKAGGRSPCAAMWLSISFTSQTNLLHDLTLRCMDRATRIWTPRVLQVTMTSILDLYFCRTAVQCTSNDPVQHIPNYPLDNEQSKLLASHSTTM
ncbi:hypothetical protein HD554DRAFT_2087162 [Boletus coccyginus]|nr:hypothetical protein HD554DRAFT_2087162 [Boletus coccyginus]